MDFSKEAPDERLQDPHPREGRRRTRATPGATTTAAIANVIEEIAGVQIMLDQLRLIFARSTDEVEEEKLRRLLGRLNSYAESNLHKWLNGQYEPGIWSRTVDAGAQPREGGAPDE